jgi:hypothetical protein
MNARIILLSINGVETAVTTLIWDFLSDLMLDNSKIPSLGIAQDLLYLIRWDYQCQIY